MIIHNEWLFVTCIAIFSLITFLQVHFNREVRLLTKSIFTYRYANLWLKESNRRNISLCLFIVFIFIFSMIFSHPSWLESEKWDFNLVLNTGLLLIFFLVLKYLIISWIGHLFQKVYLFEEIIFMSFSFEKILGLFYFPIFIISIYSPFNSKIILQVGMLFLFLFLLIKWGRIIHISIFKRSFSKIYLFLYLCTLEILPLVVLIKYFSLGGIFF